MRISKDTICNVAAIAVMVVTLVAAIYIMSRRMGLVDELDFGAGAYYYADIPEFERLVDGDAYKTSVPYWVHVLLFLGWGFVVYRLWVWVDSRPGSKRK